MHAPFQVVLRKLFERLGATYIKLGQFIASSPTLFPPEYVLEFEKCLDSTAPVPWEAVRATIAAELGGRSIESVFASIDTVPLASASVAQVHTAGGIRFPWALLPSPLSCSRRPEEHFASALSTVTRTACGSLLPTICASMKIQSSSAMQCC